jgi:transposase
MINIDPNIRVYLATGHTDMRKGFNKLSMLAHAIVSNELKGGALFVFRGRRSDRIKILWWDGQGYCLYYKCLDAGKFTWPSSSIEKSVGITKGQLAMLIEGIDWRIPKWSSRPLHAG